MNTDYTIGAIEYTLLWADVNEITLPLAIEIEVALAAKTENFYNRALNRLVSDLYNDEISQDDFINSHADLITQQFRRAFNEGMRANGLDPAKDMTSEWEQAYQGLVADEFQYVDDFAADIVRGAKDGLPVDGLRYRAGLWAHRYPDIVDQAKIITGDDNQMYTWHYGDTVEHCGTCSQYEGQTKTAREWRVLRERGIYPKSRALECKGYHCDCRLTKG